MHSNAGFMTTSYLKSWGSAGDLAQFFVEYWLNMHMTLSGYRATEYDDTTIYRWLHLLGYKHRKVTKGIFIDGHERADVVQYRDGYLQRMDQRLRRKIQYANDADGHLVAIAPDLNPGEVETVLVFHDETCYAANDGKRCLWLEEGEQVLRKKGDGKSVMVALTWHHALVLTVGLGLGLSLLLPRPLQLQDVCARCQRGRLVDLRRPR